MDNVLDEPLNKRSRLTTKTENVNNKMSSRSKVPKFRLKANGENASLSVGLEERIPLTLTDIQGLLLSTLLGNSFYQSTKWYSLEKRHLVTKCVCLVFEGVSLSHWLEHQNSFKKSIKIFENVVEIVTPTIYGGSLIEELAVVPLSEIEKESLIKEYGNMNLALESRKDLMLMMKAVFSIKSKSNENNAEVSKDKFPRTKLILSAQQLIEENFPLPLKGKYKNIYSNYVMTKDDYDPVTPESPMFALDCEMCMTSVGSELTKVSVVAENHEVVYETLVKPYNEIIDYVTQYSGINKVKLENVTKRLEDVQKDLRELLPSDAILVGQSLNIDLHALRMMHPYIIDTSYIFNFTGTRNRKPKLKTLAREFLNENIQNDKHGHCPVEDSLACLKLVQLKLNSSIEFGDAVHTNSKAEYKNVINSNGEEETQFASTIFNHFVKEKKKTLIVGCNDITDDYHTYLNRTNSKKTQHHKGKLKKSKLYTVDTLDDVINKMVEKASSQDFAMGHVKMNITHDNAESQTETLDRWINHIHKTLKDTTLYVVLFTGTVNENGTALITLKI